jgi:hypothetical protein
VPIGAPGSQALPLGKALRRPDERHQSGGDTLDNSADVT